MTAIFFAKSEEYSEGIKEYERYIKFAEAHRFSKGRITYGKKAGDNQPCWFKRIGGNDFCVFCQSTKGKDFLLFDNFVKDDTRKKRVWALMRYGLQAALSNNADTSCVRLFWHDGISIPDGYEQWANRKIQECNGYGNWSLALLSSARNETFNLEDIENTDLNDAFDSESDFEKKIKELSDKLRGLSVNECS